MIMPSVAGLLWAPPAAVKPTRAPLRSAFWTDIALFGALDARVPGAAAAVLMASDNPGVGAGPAMAGAASASDAVARTAPIRTDDFLTISSLETPALCVFRCFSGIIVLNSLP